MNTQEQISQLIGKEREDFLETHAVNIQEGQYFKPFDDEDKTQVQADFMLKNIETQRVKDELEQVKAEYKLKLKGLNDATKKLMKDTMQNGEWLNGKQFGFDDQKAGTMTYYDADGNFINSRRLTPNERQLTLHSQFKTA